MTRQRSCDQHVRYRAGCDPCNRRACRNLTQRKLRKLHGQPTSYPGVIASRWVRELRAAGYPIRYLAAHSGVAVAQIQKISTTPQRWTQLRVFQSLERTHRELRDFPGPSRRAAAIAAAKGWKPPVPQTEQDEPEADVIAVERALRGEQIKLQHADRVYAILLLTDAGQAPWQISERLHMNRGAVGRVLAGDLRERHMGRPRKTA